MFVFICISVSNYILIINVFCSRYWIVWHVLEKQYALFPTIWICFIKVCVYLLGLWPFMVAHGSPAKTQNILWATWLEVMVLVNWIVGTLNIRNLKKMEYFGSVSVNDIIDICVFFWNYLKISSNHSKWKTNRCRNCNHFRWSGLTNSPPTTPEITASVGSVTYNMGEHQINERKGEV